jgi:hypothetical protein
MSLIRTLSLDEMRFGDYDSVPVNSSGELSQLPPGHNLIVSLHAQAVVDQIDGDVEDH